jgi:excisionase family DNA binding protein
VPELPPEDRVLTPAEAAAVLGVNVKTLRAMEDRKELAPARTLGGHRRYWERAVREFAADRASAAAEKARRTEGMLTARQLAAEFGIGPAAVRKRAADEKISSAWSRGYPRLFPADEMRALLRGEREGGGS